MVGVHRVERRLWHFGKIHSVSVDLGIRLLGDNLGGAVVFVMRFAGGSMIATVLELIFLSGLGEWGVLCDGLVVGNFLNLVLDGSERQSLLETLDVCERVKRCLEVLLAQHAMFSEGDDTVH